VSAAVMEAAGSVLTNKYAEGYPAARYYGGCGVYDQIETLAIERAKQLFGAEHANVQPHSGVNANTAVYFAALKPGDRILAMDLACGGHLSHGHKATLSGTVYRASFYGVDKHSELIDYDEVRDIALRENPKMIICGASAYPMEINFARFRQIADEAGACLLADIAHYAGLIAAGVYPSPLPHADFVTLTTYKTLRGCRGGIILCRKEFAQRIDAAVFPGVQGSMHVQLIAGKAVTLKLAMSDEFRHYAAQTVANARTLAARLRDKGFRIVCGGTDSHIVLVDLRNRKVTGKEAQELLESVGILANKNRLPYDPLGPVTTSGLRLGTAAVATRGLKEQEIAEVAEIIDGVLSNPGSVSARCTARERVRELCARFPLCEESSGVKRACPR